MCGIIALEYKYQGKLPDKDNYLCTTKYSLPFHGEWTVVNGGVIQEYSHSWEIPTQRYAYDFIILNKAGKSFDGKESNPGSFYCYGQNILAPADGVVIEVGDGNPDSKITADRKAICSGRDIRGNYIVIQHSKNEYSLLAHLKPNSIIVSVGQHVMRGERIAQCGNSGNSSEPHLHFHLQAGTSFYSSPGLPIEFNNISVNPTPNYELFDDRKVISEIINTYPPYITRGHSVSNL
ncbi:murein DD-endopeptidase MepM [Oxobacter pfennigii]|uniref:Murein DD-endopeptidase MepM n=2 Tax=Oxobacter pfennigii TaxID=36849 RepID=A0A0N8NTB6_9CLOT|nr:murein DD-endopeptidase MepM [Oxobacter pfennigii]